MYDDSQRDNGEEFEDVAHDIPDEHQEPAQEEQLTVFGQAMRDLDTATELEQVKTATAAAIRALLSDFVAELGWVRNGLTSVVQNHNRLADIITNVGNNPELLISLREGLRTLGDRNIETLTEITVSDEEPEGNRAWLTAVLLQEDTGEELTIADVQARLSLSVVVRNGDQLDETPNPEVSDEHLLRIYREVIAHGATLGQKYYVQVSVRRALEKIAKENAGEETE